MTVSAKQTTPNKTPDCLTLKFANNTALDMPLGEITMINGLQHNFATGMVYSSLVHFCMLNKPVRQSSDKTPLILVLDQETLPADSLLWMYHYIKENIEGVAVTAQDVDPEEVIDYVDQHLMANGFTYAIMRVDYEDRAPAELLSVIEEMYPAAEYDLHAVMVDPGRNILAARAGIDDEDKEAIPYNLGVFREFCQHRGAAGILTSHLQSNALMLTRDEATRDHITRLTVNEAKYLEKGDEVLPLVDNQLVIAMHRDGAASWLNYSYQGGINNTLENGRIRFEDIGTLPFTYPAS